MPDVRDTDSAWDDIQEGGSVPSEKASAELSYDEMVSVYDATMRQLNEGEIVQGRVIDITADDVVVDVGYESEGLVSIDEFTNSEGELTVEKGEQVEVLLEKTEDREGHVLLSKRKAEKLRVWADVEKSYQAGETIQGRVIDRIKGGLTVDVGIRAFLPGSLVDIKPAKNLESLRGCELEFKVISMDRRRNNVVLSRKAVLEKEFAARKAETLTKLEEGALLDGVVKNITDYGVFIDLGGVDGLLHITDISWGRVYHPADYFSVGDEVQVVVLKFDPTAERVSLGYKQRSEDPWTRVDKKYPLGSRVQGKVLSLVDYGAFVELEEGVEGLIHVSEMSWTKKVVNPTKIVNVGEEVEVIVSELDLDQQRISLSLRQASRRSVQNWLRIRSHPTVSEEAFDVAVGSHCDEKHRDLLIANRVTALLGLEMIVPGGLGVDDIVACFLAVPKTGVSLAVTELESASTEASPSYALLGMFPSGVVRSIPGELRRHGSGFILHLLEPALLMDPESTLTELPADGFCVEVVVAGYVGPTA